MNPVEEFLTIQKQGMDPSFAVGLGKDVSTVGHAARLGLGFGVASATVAGLGLAAAKLYEAATKGRDFRQMLEANPDLYAHQQKDPAEFNLMYSALRTMNPEFAAEPLVAGTYMMKMIESPRETRGMVAVEALSERVPQRLGPVNEAMVEGFHKGVGLMPEEKQIGKVTTKSGPPARQRTEERTIYGQPGEQPSFRP